MESDNFYKPDEDHPVDNQNKDFQTDDSSNAIVLSALDTLPRKNPVRYIVLFISLVVVLGLFYFFIKRDILTIMGVLVGFIILAILGLKKPKDITVTVTSKLIAIDKKEFNLTNYQSFSIREVDNGFRLLSVRPVKRFTPALNIYIPNTESTDRITSFLSSKMPYSDYVSNFIDTLLQWLGI